MTLRTTKSTVAFVRPVKLGKPGEQRSAGRYPIETEEELLEGMSFPAYPRTATLTQLMRDSRRPGATKIAMVDPQQLEEAVTMDGLQAPASNVDLPKVES